MKDTLVSQNELNIRLIFHEGIDPEKALKLIWDFREYLEDKGIKITVSDVELKLRLVPYSNS